LELTIIIMFQKNTQYHNGYNNHTNNTIANNDNMGSGYTTLNNSPVHLENSLPSSPSSTSTLNENKDEKDGKDGSNYKTKNPKVYNKSKMNDKLNKKPSFSMTNEDNNTLDTVVNNPMSTVTVSE